MTDHAPPSPDTQPGPPSWPYSNAMAKANNIIWRLCKGVSPQQIYDALDAEGLAIIDKTGNAQTASLQEKYDLLCEVHGKEVQRSIALEIEVRRLRAALAPGHAGANQSAPQLRTPHNSGEQQPKGDPAGCGADTGHAGAGEAWQPIETAPKDGTHILTALPWLPYPKTLFWARYAGGWRCPALEDKHEYRPTHWMPLPTMPLPAAPLSATQGDGG